jgi:hypothetical protein
MQHLGREAFGYTANRKNSRKLAVGHNSKKTGENPV